MEEKDLNRLRKLEEAMQRAITESLHLNSYAVSMAAYNQAKSSLNLLWIWFPELREKEDDTWV